MGVFAERTFSDPNVKKRTGAPSVTPVWFASVAHAKLPKTKETRVDRNDFMAKCFEIDLVISSLEPFDDVVSLINSGQLFVGKLNEFGRKVLAF